MRRGGFEHQPLAKPPVKRPAGKGRQKLIKRLIALGVAAVIFGGGGFALYRFLTDTDDTLGEIFPATASIGTIQSKVSGRGTAKAKEQAAITLTQSGTVQEVFVLNGNGGLGFFHIWHSGILLFQTVCPPSGRQPPACTAFSSAPAGGGGGMRLAKGDMVSHRAFGQGMVLSVQAMGGDALVEIAFEPEARLDTPPQSSEGSDRKVFPDRSRCSDGTSSTNREGRLALVRPKSIRCPAQVR